MIWDVAVIGSGPAGCAVAIHCGRAGLRTAVFTLPGHRSSSEAPETLPAAARPLLEALGITNAPDRFGLRPQYAMSSAWGSDSLTTRHSICNPDGPGWFVDRPAFDAAIACTAANHGAVSMIPGRIASVSNDGSHWVLHFRVTGESQPVTVRAAAVVDATGRASAFARRLGLRRTAFDGLISVSTRALPRGSAAGEALVESAADGWWFSALTGRGELSVSWFTESALLRLPDRSLATLEARLQATTHTAARVAKLLPGAFEWRPARTDRLEVFGGDGWLSVGDAALACDPLGSQGLLRALQSAAMASELIVRDRTYTVKNLSAYRQFQIDYLQRFLQERHSFYAMERRWPEARFWRRVQ